MFSSPCMSAPAPFLPVKADRVADHRMHAETGIGLRRNGAADQRRASGRRPDRRRRHDQPAPAGKLHRRRSSRVRPFAGETDIFIVPGSPVRSADLLLTNFHLPRSTLFMLVCAFAGTARMKAAYAHAVETGYRFYSYGDACLLERAL